MSGQQVKRVVGVFGGRKAMSESTPYTYGKIRQWEKTGFVPSSEYQNLLNLASSMGLALTPYDFIAHLVVGK